MSYNSVRSRKNTDEFTELLCERLSEEIKTNPEEIKHKNSPSTKKESKNEETVKKTKKCACLLS